MNHEILICYKSVTGFTEKYAEMIAKETGGKLIKAGKVTAEIMSMIRWYLEAGFTPGWLTG